MADSGVPQTAIPDKLFFRIGEVSELTGVEAYVLRYWESEFKALSPRKSESGQRMFRKKDVELLLRIKHLLYDRKFTIEGARMALLENTAGSERKAAVADIRDEIANIIKILS
jgi:DNA-binding transcriptional MerR regulator